MLEAVILDSLSATSVPNTNIDITSNEGDGTTFIYLADNGSEDTPSDLIRRLNNADDHDLLIRLLHIRMVIYC